MTIMPRDEVQKLLDGTTPELSCETFDLAGHIYGPGGNLIAETYGAIGGNAPQNTRLFTKAPNLARSLLAAHDEIDRLRADAQAAVALVVERAAEAEFPDTWRDDAHAVHRGGGLKEQRTWSAGFNACRKAVRDLAPTDGLALVAELRAEVDRLQADVRTYQDIVRDMTAQVEALTGALQGVLDAQLVSPSFHYDTLTRSASEAGYAALAAQAPATQTGE